MSNRPDAPDQAQRDLIKQELDKSMLVEAAAGTGKTTSIIDRMVALLSTGNCQIDTLAAVTFTRKAASEIRDRFQVALAEAHQEILDKIQSGKPVSELESQVEKRLTTALENQQRCFIGTIHSFCARLLRERPVEAKLEIDFQEIDEAEDAQLRARAWRQYVDKLLAVDAPIVEELETVGLRLGRSTTTRRRVINDLEELGLELPQLGAAFTEMAGFPDVVDWPAPPQPLPEVEPAREAFDEYLAHLESLNLFQVPPGTCRLIPKINRLVLASRHMPWRQPTPPTAGADEEDWQQHEQAARRAIANFMSLLEHFDGSDPDETQKQWPGKRDQALAEKARWIEFRDRWALPLLQQWREHRYEKVIKVLRPAMDEYDQLRRERNALNFEDLLMKARDLLQHSPEVRAYFRERVTHLLVDEFQDTDPLQAELMMLLTADDIHETDWRKCRPAPGSLFVVGDPKQSIYRFRRADIEIYLTVYEILESCASIVHLSANFRSDDAMIGWINETFEPVFPEQATPHQAPRRNLEHSGVQCKVGDAVTAERAQVDETRTQWPAANSEARWVAARVQQLLRENPDLKPGDFMLLTPTRKRLNVYSDALRAAGIPHEVTGGSELNQSTELRLLRELLRAAARPDDPIALVSVLRGELFGISDETLYRWRSEGPVRLSTPPPQGAQDSPASEADPSNPSQGGGDEQTEALQDALERIKRCQRWLSRLPLPVAIERIADDSGLTAHAAAVSPSRAGAFGKALELLRCGAVDGSASDLLSRLDALVDSAEQRDGAPLVMAEQGEKQAAPSVMQVMNLHKAKGLEAAVVFLADPSGRGPGKIHLHIDRSSDDSPPRGYLAVYSGLRKGLQKWESNEKLLACPKGWSDYEAREREYLDAEQRRLMYVAATRAGSKLICCPRDKYNNPWVFFADRFPDQAESDAADQYQAQPPLKPEEMPAETPQQYVQQQWAASLTPTYHLAALKELGLKGAPVKPVGDDPDGAAWGSAVHAVLEVMLKTPDSDPNQVAVAALQQQGLDTVRAAELVQMLKQVEKSTIWERAMKSSQCYCEVPLTTLLPSSLASLGDPNSQQPLLVRGVIDLVFREQDNWVVVDYKSDAINAIEMQAATQHYRGQLDAYAAAWEHLSQETVAEKGILFTYHSRYLTV